MSLIVEPIPAFSDNYIWLLHAPGSDSACVVDPGDASPVERVLAERNLKLVAILVTHHHGDHVGGINTLTWNTDIPVFGPGDIPQVTHAVTGGDQLELLGQWFQVFEVPGHTLDHIAFYCADSSLLFCGDTLFAGGCGRLFEGSAAEMWQSLQRLAQLPGNTSVYCAHEYTQSNLRFALTVEPGNPKLQERADQVNHLRSQAMATVPSFLAEELQTNPFLRAANKDIKEAAERFAGCSLDTPEDVFRVVRQWKDGA
ncbi:MAG: hydroxyacylglutathione hydrolase [Porticoccaceae bacterium]